MKKRILSMLIVLTMVISLIVVPGSTATAATYYDTVDTDYELAVDVLDALGIMRGYTDGSFLPYNTITKAEMVSIAVKLAGIDEYITEVPDDMELFNDMYANDDHWAASVIAIAKTAGIARSDADGNFNPDMTATYEDAVQMVVSALGYGHQAQARGDSLLDYVYVGQRLGITKKLDSGIGNNITRADVAKMVYRALTVDIMEPVKYSVDGTLVTYEAVKGKNALNTYFDVYEVNGIISETEYSAIYGETSVDEQQVTINYEVFNTGHTDIYNYLGYYATVYALTDDDSTEGKTVIAYSVKSVKNNTLTLESDIIHDVTYTPAEGYTFEYWVNKETDRKPKDVTTATAPLVLYNGKSASGVTVDLLKPERGHVILIDNNGDDTYDIIDVWDYELVHVFSVSQTSGSVVNYYDLNAKYDLDPTDEDYNVTFVNAQGGIAQFSDIKQDSVLYIYESADKEMKKVVISNNKINGMVSEATSDGYYVINGVEYEISPAVLGRLEIAVSDEGDFFLDADGRIAYFEGTTVIRQNIGMFITIKNGGLRGGFQVKVLASSGGVKVYDLASSIKVNGKTMSVEAFYENAFENTLFGRSEDPQYEAAGILRPHPSRSAFLYKLNSKGEICDVTVVDDENKYLQTRQIKTAGSLYYSKGYSCLHYSEEKTTDEYDNVVGVRTYCDNKTVNFLVEEAITKTENQSFYTKYMTDYWDNYNFEAYDYCWAYYYSPTGEPINMQKTVCNFLVMADWYSEAVDSSDDESQNTDATYYQDNTSPKFIYKITEANDRTSGKNTYRVYYFDGTSLRNNLIRPKYSAEAFNGSKFYATGFPVRISMDGSYIEDIAPYFGSLYADMTDMVTPIHNERTNSMIMPMKPFYEEQVRAWNWWSRNSSYYSQFYCGVIFSIDEVVGRKLFSVAAATVEEEAAGENGENLYEFKVLSNERLEGTVYRMNFDREGHLESISRGSLDDITPGQLVLVRRRAYNNPAKWESLTGYSVNELFIISDDITELEYLDDFYAQVQSEVVIQK